MGGATRSKVGRGEGWEILEKKSLGRGVWVGLSAPRN